MVSGLAELDLQKKIFSEKIQRKGFLDYIPSSKNKFKAFVYRNHSFELVQSTIKPYLDFADMQVEFEYSDYDDSLSFFALNKDSDFLILWLDLIRYKMSSFKEFLEKRLLFLKSVYRKPALLVCIGENVTLTLDSQFYQMDVSDIEAELGVDFFDERLEMYSGTRLSSNACMMISRKLGLQYIPALVRPSLKSIVVDLDNTLYSGVLGEDGCAGLILMPGHIGLQGKLKELSEEGFLVCIVSKNEKSDVENLFKSRKDFPLKLEDFTMVCASWSDKSESINRISETLKIGIDSMLFIDDNPGELLQVKARYPYIHEIWATQDIAMTNRALTLYPGLIKQHTTYEDNIRKRDLQANTERRRMQQCFSNEDYLSTLGVVITFNVNDRLEMKRISELAKKTNQFIFNYKRYSVTEMEERINSGRYAICTIALEDKLSDSGIIGTCVVERDGDIGKLEECFVSCRALGRGLEEVIVMGAVTFSLDILRVSKLMADIIVGERNTPAINFYKRCFMEYSEAAYIEYKIPNHLTVLHKVEGLMYDNKKLKE